MSQHVQVETDGAVRIVRMARPEKKNALTLAMYEAMTAALVEAGRDEAVRAVILAGQPGVFTAGNDLGDFLQAPPAGEGSPVFRFLQAISGFEKGLVAAVDGPAVGLGTTMLLHCDLVVASTRSRFVLPFVNLGVVPEAASSLLLPLTIGAHRAAEWILLGEPIAADKAYEAGFLNRLVAPEEVESTARQLATALAARPPEALRLSKRLLREPFRDQVRAAMAREGDIFVERLRSAEAIQAMTAFMTRKG